MPYPEHAYIHDNHISGGGKQTGGPLWKNAGGDSWASPFPEIFYDGVLNPKQLKDGKLPPELGIRFERNGNVGFRQHPFRPVDAGEDRGRQNRRRPRHHRTTREAFRDWPPSICRRTGAPTRPATSPPRFTGPPTQKLSDYGFFQGNGRTQQPVAGVIPYDVNTPLFSDYTSKHRFVRLPPGTSIAYREDDVFDFPVGTKSSRRSPCRTT